MSSKRKSLWFAGGLSAICWSYLAVVSRNYADASLFDLLAVVLICFLASCWVWCLYRHEQQPPIVEILGFALLFRVIGMATFPVLEDDFYRYLWDGYVGFETGNPYNHPPAAWFDRDVPTPMGDILDTINYPYVATVYGPSLQWLFMLSYAVAPAALWPLKLILLIGDIAVILVLLRLAPKQHIILYAWSPLIIKEFVVSLHPDLIGACFMLLAVFAYTRKQDYFLGVFLALALGVKVFAIVVTPFLLLLNWRAWTTFLLTAFLIAAPFGLINAWLPQGLATMSQDWLFNAALYELLSDYVAINQLKWVLATLYTIGVASYGLNWLRQRWPNTSRYTSARTVVRGDYLFAGLFLIIPALNPWYLIWLLPFAVIWPTPWAWMASFALMISYASGINLPTGLGTGLQDYQHPDWILIIEFGLIVTALIVTLVIKTAKKMPD